MFEYNPIALRQASQVYHFMAQSLSYLSTRSYRMIRFYTYARTFSELYNSTRQNDVKLNLSSHLKQEVVKGRSISFESHSMSVGR